MLNRILLLIITALSFTGPIRVNAEALQLDIDLDTGFQTIRGFGASDAWAVEAVGKDWPPAEREQVARWLFSNDIDSGGRAEGIGLSMWRFNIGAGSAEQGEQSAIKKPSQRVQGFLSDSGEYDWSKQSGQRWLLSRAHHYGVEKFVAFSNSPPVQWTRNGIAHGSGGYQSNLYGDHFEDFANFLADTLAQFRAQQMPFDYISPINEPQYQWESQKQEGSPWTNQELARLVRLLDAALTRRGLDTAIMISEAAEYDYLSGGFGDDLHNRQIARFWDPQSELYLGDLAHVPALVAGHSYWTIYDNQQIIGTRSRLRQATERYGLEFFQTEYCLLGLDRITEDKPASAWDMALFMAKIMHADLAIANASSWSFWTALADSDQASKNRYLLIETRDNQGTPVPIAHKTLWVLGQYSKFVRPGYQRLALSINEKKEPALSAIMASAFLSPQQERLILVFTNLDERDYQIQLLIRGGQAGKTYGQPQVFITDERRDLQYKRSGENTIPARSVVTWVLNRH